MDPHPDLPREALKALKKGEKLIEPSLHPLAVMPSLTTITGAGFFNFDREIVALDPSRITEAALLRLLDPSGSSGGAGRATESPEYKALVAELLEDPGGGGRLVPAALVERYLDVYKSSGELTLVGQVDAVRKGAAFAKIKAWLKQHGERGV